MKDDKSDVKKELFKKKKKATREERMEKSINVLFLKRLLKGNKKETHENGRTFNRDGE